VGRSALLCIVAYVSAALWPTPGLLLFLKLPVLALLVLASYVLLGEFSTGELTALRTLLLRRPLAREETGES
jgi:hypothetical protein